MLKWAGVLEALKEAQFYGIYAQELLFSQKKKSIIILLLINNVDFFFF